MKRMTIFLSQALSLLSVASIVVAPCRVKARTQPHLRQTAASEDGHRNSPVKIEANWTYAEKRLRAAGLKKQFISALHDFYQDEKIQEVIELNVLLFLRKANIHQPQITADAVEHIRDFMEAHKAVLCEVEKKEAVPGSVIASLLWMESRYGENLGKFKIASVFVDLIQADRAEVIAILKSSSAARFSDHPSKRDLQKIASRAHKKALWAVAEIKAMQSIYEKIGTAVFDIRGSYAGAFGMSQFLPSSYRKIASGGKTSKALDLNQPEDAIRSVAIYLHQNGWRKQNQKTHVKALMNYNNSRDYANAILELATSLSNPRTPSSESRRVATLTHRLPAKKSRHLAQESSITKED